MNYLNFTDIIRHFVENSKGFTSIFDYISPETVIGSVFSLIQNQAF